MRVQLLKENQVVTKIIVRGFFYINIVFKGVCFSSEDHLTTNLNCLLKQSLILHTRGKNQTQIFRHFSGLSIIPLLSCAESPQFAGPGVGYSSR